MTNKNEKTKTLDFWIAFCCQLSLINSRIDENQSFLTFAGFNPNGINYCFVCSVKVKYNHFCV